MALCLCLKLSLSYTLWFQFTRKICPRNPNIFVTRVEPGLRVKILANHNGLAYESNSEENTLGLRRSDIYPTLTLLRYSSRWGHSVVHRHQNQMEAWPRRGRVCCCWLRHGPSHVRLKGKVFWCAAARDVTVVAYDATSEHIVHGYYYLFKMNSNMIFYIISPFLPLARDLSRIPKSARNS